MISRRASLAAPMKLFCAGRCARRHTFLLGGGRSIRNGRLTAQINKRLDRVAFADKISARPLTHRLGFMSKGCLCHVFRLRRSGVLARFSWRNRVEDV